MLAHGLITRPVQGISLLDLLPQVLGHRTARRHPRPGPAQVRERIGVPPPDRQLPHSHVQPGLRRPSTQPRGIPPGPSRVPGADCGIPQIGPAVVRPARQLRMPGRQPGQCQVTGCRAR